MEPLERFELPTPGFEDQHSSTELKGQFCTAVAKLQKEQSENSAIRNPNSRSYHMNFVTEFVLSNKTQHFWQAVVRSVHSKVSHHVFNGVTYEDRTHTISVTARGADHYTKITTDWCVRKDSNLRPLASQANTLIRLSYGRILVAEAGFEPAIPGL